MQRIGTLRFNPLRATSALLLVFSPLLTWITIVSVVIYQNLALFGTAAQSNLLMISSQELGTNISEAAVAGSTASLYLLVAGGIAMTKSAKLGVPLSGLGLAAYFVPMFPVFGSETAGLEQTFISPGVGFFVAGMGVFLGFISLLVKSQPLSTLVHIARTRWGVSVLGVSIGSVGLTIDVLNHAALGQLSDFIGLTPIERAFHLGLVVGVVGLLAFVTAGRRIRDYRSLFFILSVVTLAILGADGAYAFSTGNVHDFLGHNPTEIALHFTLYYGVALALISNLLTRD